MFRSAFMLYLLSCCCHALAQRTVSMKTPKGEIELAITGATVDSVGGFALGSILAGSVTNRTSVDLQLLKFELILLDQDGQNLHSCLVEMSVDRICTIRVYDRIPRNATVPLQAPGNRFHPSRKAPKGKAISGYTAQVMDLHFLPEYVFETKAKESPQFDIRFNIDIEHGISFELKNKLETPIEILWDQSSFINERDESSRVVHTNVKFVDKEHSQPNTVVPPFAKLNETVFPSVNVEFVSSKWSTKPLLPSSFRLAEDSSYLDALVGKSLRLFLRMMIDEKKVDYLATFKVKAVNH